MASDQAARDLAETIGNFLNGALSRDRKDFVAAMSHQHRTLQQAFTGLCLAWLNHLANLKEGSGEYDGRNEASVKTARKIKMACPEIEWGLPLI
jgi:hypothetical protein